MKVPKNELTSFAKTGDLTVMDKKIVNLIANGLTTKEIAAKLETSDSDIEWYRMKMFKKCQVVSSPQLIHWCYQNGILKVCQ